MDNTFGPRASPGTAAGFGRFLRVLIGFVGPQRPRPLAYEWFTESEVAGLDSAVHSAGIERIDDATWRDLEVKRYLRLIAESSSILGRQSLFHRLRMGADAERVRALMELGTRPDDATVQRVRWSLRCVETDVTEVFRDPPAAPPGWPGVGLVPYVSAASALLLFSQFWLIALLVLVSCVLIGGVIQLHSYRAIAKWQAQRAALLAVLRGGLELVELQRRQPTPLLEDVESQDSVLKGLMRRFSPRWVHYVPGLVAYLNLFALHDFLELRRQAALVERSRAEILTVYRAIADFEADVCLLEHLANVRAFCWPEFSAGKVLVLTEAVNPLLAGAVPLSIELHDSGAFVSGPNGAGKSTWLRAIGLNVLSARAFGFCYATRAALPSGPVYSSIANEDSLADGVSLFMAELSRAERLAHVAGSRQDAVVLIDEPFRGTNFAESTAAAAGLLRFLAQRCLVVAASHNLLLASLLSRHLTPWRVVVDASSKELKLHLEPGQLAAPNGLALLKTYSFDSEVSATAERVFGWLSGSSPGSPVPEL
jgi:hypothetical protein